MSMLEAALSYAARGSAVFPLKPGTKIPLTANGFKNASTDEAQIRAWWGQEPLANVAIATGRVSGVFVLDVDKKSGGLETMADMLPGFVCDRVATTGGGGMHFYFAHPGFDVRNRAGVWPGIDIRGDGGYVVAPPSVLSDGGAYVWKTDEHSNLMAPDWLIAVIRPTEEKPWAAAPALPEGERGDLNKRTLRFLVSGAPQGQWHQEYYQACMDLKQQGYTYDEAHEKLERMAGTLDTTHDIPQLDWAYKHGVVRYAPNMPAEANYAPNAPAEPAGAAGLAAPGGAPGSAAMEQPVGEEGEPLVLSAASLLPELHAYLSDEGLVFGESTGIPGLDLLLCGKVGGGLRPGELVSLTAVAKTGKSTLLHKIVHSLVSRGKLVGYASREMSPATEVLPDLLSIEMKQDVERAVYRPESLAEHTAIVSKWNLSFAGGFMAMPFDDLEQWIRSLHSRGVTHFFGDHAHLFVEDSEEFKEIARYLKRLKRLVNTLKINFFMVVQPKGLGPDQRLNMHSIRGGANMNQLFNSMIMMERYGERGQHLSRVWLEAGRSKLAKQGEIFLQYQPSSRDLTEVSVEQEPVDPAPETSAQPKWGEKFRVMA